MSLDIIVRVWSECFYQLHLRHEIEPTLCYVESDYRSRLLATDPLSGNNIELDVSLAHPWALDVVSKAAKEEGAAGLKRESLKESLYASRDRPASLNTTSFVPLVFEHFGRWGLEAQKFLNHLAMISKTFDMTDCSLDTFKSLWRTRFSVALQKCNAKVIIQKMTHISYSKNSCSLPFSV